MLGNYFLIQYYEKSRPLSQLVRWIDKWIEGILRRSLISDRYNIYLNADLACLHIMSKLKL